MSYNRSTAEILNIISKTEKTGKKILDLRGKLSDKSNKDINEIFKAVSNLPNLTELALSENQLTELPNTITELKNLTYLNLSRNQLTELPNTITKLKNLTELALSGNQLTELPNTITKLENLTYLALSENKLTELPNIITKLKNLTELALSGNQLTELPNTITKLENLTYLDLSENKLTELPNIITKLKNLTLLALSGNQLTELPNTITKLENLTYLDLSENQLTKLPNTITKLENLTELALRGNRITYPPMAVIKQGIDAIRVFFKEIKEKGEESLYHLKILLAGEPKAGKTSLMKRLTEPEYTVPCKDEPEESTVGIDIQEWVFKYNNTDLKVNLWDFGGQQIQYMIHHFFLTPESLYILVSDKREETGHFDYWFNIISLLGKGDSEKKATVLVAENEIDIKNKNSVFDYKTYKERYNNELKMPDPISVNLSNQADTDGRFNMLKKKIKKLVFENKITVPSNWINIKKKLDTIKEKEKADYINIDRFYAICKKYNLTDKAKQKIVLKTFNNIGILNYYEHASLADKIFLNPKWITEPIYFILKDSDISDNNGRFTKDTLFGFLDEKYKKDKEYKESEKNILLSLMLKENFEICYKIDNKKYIAPQFLPDNAPDAFKDWNNQENLRFKAEYPFMPAGIMSRLIVRLNEYIKKENKTPLVWKKGVVLNYKETDAYILDNIDKDAGIRFIDIRISGYTPNKRECLYIIRGEIEKIHKKSFRGITYKEKLACACPECKEGEPHFFKLDDLNRCISKDRAGKIQCLKSFNSISARDLLDGISYKKEEKNKGMNSNNNITYNVGGNVYGNMGNRQNNTGNNININPGLKEVLEILPALIKELKKNTTDPEDNENIKIIEEAQKEAEKGNEQKARKILYRAYDWILNTGSKIATGAGINLIVKYLGG
ncbi:MAG: leucine-rich repeat domain-containing protein [Deltaproteobacteria bacterium]|nr:leucine-rich repeat domain-containing protein [Deltaproteobacteria bacterium]